MACKVGIVGVVAPAPETRLTVVVMSGPRRGSGETAIHARCLADGAQLQPVIAVARLVRIRGEQPGPRIADLNRGPWQHVAVVVIDALQSLEGQAADRLLRFARLRQLVLDRGRGDVHAGNPERRQALHHRDEPGPQILRLVRRHHRRVQVRALADDAVGLAIGKVLDDAALRIFRRAGNAGGLERQAVAHRAVPAGPRQHHGILRRGDIQVLAGEVAILLLRFTSAQPKPVIHSSRAQLLGLGAQHGLDVRHRLGVLGIDRALSAASSDAGGCP